MCAAAGVQVIGEIVKLSPQRPSDTAINTDVVPSALQVNVVLGAFGVPSVPKAGPVCVQR